MDDTTVHCMVKGREGGKGRPETIGGEDDTNRQSIV